LGTLPFAVSLRSSGMQTAAARGRLIRSRGIALRAPALLGRASWPAESLAAITRGAYPQLASAVRTQRQSPSLLGSQSGGRGQSFSGRSRSGSATPINGGATSRRARQHGSGGYPGRCTFSAPPSSACDRRPCNFTAQPSGARFWRSAALSAGLTRFLSTADTVQCNADEARKETRSTATAADGTGPLKRP
jgi:hypothetical protein